MRLSGGGSADLWRMDGTNSSSQVKPTFFRIFSACRAAASASLSWSEPNRPHTPRQPLPIDERSHGSSAEGANVVRRDLTFWSISFEIVRAFGSVNWEPLTS